MASVHSSRAKGLSRGRTSGKVRRTARRTPPSSHMKARRGPTTSRPRAALAALLFGVVLGACVSCQKNRGAEAADAKAAGPIVLSNPRLAEICSWTGVAAVANGICPAHAAGWDWRAEMGLYEVQPNTTST